MAKTRSPNAPNISLGTAVDFAKKLWEAEQRHATPKATILKHWRYTLKSSTGGMALAALKSFGLLQYQGRGTDMKGKLTDLALDLVVDERDTAARRKALKKAALAPRVHAELWEEFGGSLPSDDSLRVTLIREKKFAANRADAFIRQFRATIEYANLSASDAVSEEEAEENGRGFSVGDYVQFAAPPGSRAQMKQATLPLDEGVITLQWPATLSPDSKESADAWIELIVKRLIHKTAESTEDEPPTEPND